MVHRRMLRERARLSTRSLSSQEIFPENRASERIWGHATGPCLSDGLCLGPPPKLLTAATEEGNVSFLFIPLSEGM